MLSVLKLINFIKLFIALQHYMFCCKHLKPQNWNVL